MIKYYKNGFSIYKVDLENNEVTTATNHPYNKGIVYSFGMAEIAVLWKILFKLNLE